MRARRPTILLAAIGLAAILAGCGISRANTNGVAVVAAENFWGSIAAQIVGDKGSVQSIITNPAQDPHSYEPSANDARLLATSQLAIVNGLGYDPWAAKLLAANPDGKRVVLTVGTQFKLHDGDNPHRWYSPADVDGMAYYITAALSKLDPKDADYYAARLATFETKTLHTYHQLIAEIKHRYQGVPVGASESIFALQAPPLGLTLLTPPSFMKAVSEGTEVSAHDTITTQAQIAVHAIKVWIFNSQNATPQVQRLTAAARANHIPIVAITETLTPATATFEQWQAAQLERLERALHEATGR
ncbi:MAG TPA: zinc ABC transporter substrate-binding protein [Solirubrobacteraceae bacterium]|nr:zinc ABC transporter substrate-binding protein [Solirubrobacteraceae bacterium]